MGKIKNFIESNNFEECVNYFQELENNEYEIKSLINEQIGEYGLFIIYILLSISHKRNTSFWFNITGYTLSFHLSHIEGAERTALNIFKKSFEINPNDNTTLKAILDFKNPPEKILTNKELEFYSKFKKD